jgi:hypothetical protein
MTLVVGLSTSRGVWIGADSGSTIGEATEICSAPKLWRSNGWLVASAGNWRALEIMRYDLEFPAPGNNPHRALCMDLNTLLGQAFERNDWTLKEDSEGEIDVTDAYWILAAYKDSLFMVDYNGHVEKVKRAAIGTGTEYALGMLDHSEIGSAEKRIRKALVQTAKRYRMLIGPYHIEKA